jgi:phenylpropionate dioxygenase-like ring-hydroxylating dioxygenase large terminal subunit
MAASFRYEEAQTIHEPPDFLASRNRRQKARAAGMHPDYWYPVAHSRKLARGKVLATRFWGRPIAVYRDQNGQVHAVEDRCAHRQVELSKGIVKGCNLVCQYHGWEYAPDGKVVAIPHELFGKPFPKLSVPSFPCQERYGHIWVFPGDPAKASQRRLPDIPELEGKNRWGIILLDGVWRAHHTMLMENICDFTHGYLHRDHRPFWDPKLTHYEAVGDRVNVGYDTKVGAGKIFRHFVDDKKVNANHMELSYEYPFQWSNTDNKIKSYCFLLPQDEKTTHGFFIFYFQSLKIPLLPMSMPPGLLDRVLKIAKRLFVQPVIDQDAWAVESEQRGYDRYHELPVAEFSPVVSLFQQLTIRKWEEYLATKAIDGLVPAPTAPTPRRS